ADFHSLPTHALPISQYNQVGNHSLPPVLDLEVAEGKSPEQLSAWTREFLTELESLTGRTPMVYTYRYFWIEKMNNSQEFANYPRSEEHTSELQSRFD